VWAGHRPGNKPAPELAQHATRLIVGRFVVESPGLDPKRHPELVKRLAREAAYLRRPPMLDMADIKANNELNERIRQQVMAAVGRSSVGPGSVAALIAKAVLNIMEAVPPDPSSFRSVG